MPDKRQPHAPYPQPTDALAGETAREMNSSREGSVAPPAIPASEVSTRPLLIPDDGTEATPPGPDATDGPLSRSGTPQTRGN